MDNQQSYAVFGLHFLQDMKGIPADIPGAYDPEQELWVMPEQAQDDLPGVNDDFVRHLVFYLEQNKLSCRS